MKKIKTYGFWTAFAGAFIVFLNALGDLFGFQIESELVKNLIMAFAGVLVAVGVVSMGNEKQDSQEEQSDEMSETEQAQSEEKQEDSGEEEGKN